MDKSKTFGNPATSNAKDIVLYDEAFQYKYSLAQVLSHELAHIIFDDLKAEEQDKFAEESDWIVLKMNGETLYVPKSKKEKLQDDSSNSINEDFANHIEEFLFNEGKVKSKSSRAESWIKSKYGKEFKVRKRNRE